MLTKLKKYHKGNVLSLEKNKNDPHSQDVKLFPDLPIICKVNNQELDTVNNEMFTVKKKMIQYIVI